MISSWITKTTCCSPLNFTRSRSLLRSSNSVVNRCASGGAADEKGDSPSYFDRKAARKEKRVTLYQAKLQRKASLRERRDQSPKDVLKNDFQSWWQIKIAQEQKWDRQARQQGKDWKIEVAVVLERLPQVLPDKEDFEKDFEELQSHLAQFGKEYPKEFSSPLPGDGHSPVSDEELLALLPEGFKPAPRETAADESGQTDTLDRKLKDRVYLLVDGQLPRSILEDPESESLLDAAKKAVEENGGGKLDLYCPSNSPIAVQMKKSDDDNDDFFGTKTFFLRLQHDEGNIDAKKDFAWLDKGEIIEGSKEEHDSKFYEYLL